MSSVAQISYDQFNSQQKEAVELAIQWFKGWKDKRHTKQVFRLAGFAGTGKAQPISSIIQTPNGERKIGDLKVGDFVMGQNGQPIKVIGVYPQGVQETYEVSFRDGTSTKCNLDHLWTVHDLHKRKRTASLRSLIESGIWTPSGLAKFKIPLCEPVEYSNPKPEFDPYVIGALIGDGCLVMSTPALSVAWADADIMGRIKDRLTEYSFTENPKEGCSQWTIHVNGHCHKRNPLMEHIRAIGLNVKSGEKFIPDQYKFAPVESRFELLRGLMDTDGSCRANRCSFSTTSERLADDLAWLVRSLGGVAIKRINGTTYTGAIEWCVNVKTNFNPFHAKRKAAEHKPSPKNPPSRAIWDAKSVGFEEQVCIKVDAEDELYLTNDFIVTHNTTVARYIADMCSGGVNLRVEFIAPTGKAASRLRQKGCPGARTLHQFAYNIRGENEEGEPIFVGKGDLDYKPVLIVMDESSMVGEYDFNMVERHGVPILCLGDYGQLPPVKATQVFNEANADYTLTDIERNTGNIVKASMYARQGMRLPLREYDDVKVRSGRIPDDQILSHCGEDAQMLSSYHNTRINLNKRARRLLGFTNMLPMIGEKLVCKFNQHDHGIMNGEQGIVIGFKDIPDYELGDNEMSGMQYIIYKSLTYGKEMKAKFNPACFYEGEHHEELRKESMKGAGAWDFGYALTIHSSQGSEWERVLMADELMRGIPYAQMAYTGFTRAIKHLMIYRED